jgi:hypothetical protein
MITGYNTDVRHLDVVFHVQTEDKGAENPLIESLVYVGGQVLAAKRASYADLLGADGGGRSIVELMERQHRIVIAAIKSGRFDAKLQAVSEARKTGPQPAAAAAPAGAAPAGDGTSTGVITPPEPPPGLAGDDDFDSERTLDQVILEYLTNEADQEQLLLTLDGDDNVRLGIGARVTVRTTSSKTGQGVAGARVHVRMISTVDDPRVLTSGQTGADGSLTLTFDVPKLERGTAALIVSAVSDIGDAEIKHLL